MVFRFGGGLLKISYNISKVLRDVTVKSTRGVHGIGYLSVYLSIAQPCHYVKAPSPCLAPICSML